MQRTDWISCEYESARFVHTCCSTYVDRGTSVVGRLGVLRQHWPSPLKESLSAGRELAGRSRTTVWHDMNLWWSTTPGEFQKRYTPYMNCTKRRQLTYKSAALQRQTQNYFCYTCAAALMLKGWVVEMLGIKMHMHDNHFSHDVRVELIFMLALHDCTPLFTCWFYLINGI